MKTDNYFLPFRDFKKDETISSKDFFDKISCMYSKNTPLFVEFDKPKNEITYIKGNIYSFINENNQREYGEFIKQEGSKLTFKLINT